jgi:hypothetical protein
VTGIRAFTAGRGAAALATAALGAGLVAVGAAGWLRVPATTSISAEVLSVPGATAVPVVPAAALVLLAAAIALLLAGRLARVVAAVTISLVGVGTAAAIGAFRADPAEAAMAASAAATGLRRSDVAPVLTAWPVVALVLAGLAVVAGVLVLVHSRRWAAAAGVRFERHSETGDGHGPVAADPGTASSARIRAMDDWDALSRGEDPS